MWLINLRFGKGRAISTFQERKSNSSGSSSSATRREPAWARTLSRTLFGGPVRLMTEAGSAAEVADVGVFSLSVLDAVLACFASLSASAGLEAGLLRLAGARFFGLVGAARASVTSATFARFRVVCGTAFSFRSRGLFFATGAIESKTAVGSSTFEAPFFCTGWAGVSTEGNSSSSSSSGITSSR
ncbi:hypothetical protein C8R47DRAFT_1164436 [Mycena vitilis]|nr:hypothetical protein C8R47DRAFT_1164436 [Mycena vitilis]